MNTNHNSPASRIPTEYIPRGNMRILFKTIMVSLLTALVLNILAAFILHFREPNRGYWLIQQKWARVNNAGISADWIILGDSSANQGVVPDIIEQQRGDSAVNLATIGDVAVIHDAWILDAWLKQHPAPRYVLVVHAYDVFARPLHIPSLANIPISWRELNTLRPRLAFSNKEKRQWILARMAPLYARNESLKTLILSPGKLLNGPGFSLDDKGYMAWKTANPEGVRADVQRHLKSVAESTPSISQRARVGLKTLALLAREYDMQIIIAFSPMCEEMANQPEFRQQLIPLRKAITDFADKHPQITFINEIKTYPAGQMENADHVIDNAARDFTRWLLSKDIGKK